MLQAHQDEGVVGSAGRDGGGGLYDADGAAGGGGTHLVLERQVNRTPHNLTIRLHHGNFPQNQKFHQLQAGGSGSGKETGVCHRLPRNLGVLRILGILEIALALGFLGAACFLRIPGFLDAALVLGFLEDLLGAYHCPLGFPGVARFLQVFGFLGVCHCPLGFLDDLLGVVCFLRVLGFLGAYYCILQTVGD